MIMRNQRTITRKAILIGAPGSRTSYLRGVEKDLVRMSRFLQSNKGGAWKSHEIVVLDNPFAADVLSRIETTLADYVVVYFSGHGFTDRNSRARMVALRDGHLPDWCLLNSSPRQLVLIDACRNIASLGLGSLPSVWDGVDHFESVSTYNLFSQYIANSPGGKMIIHATQPGKYSYDSPSGGIFTQALLNASSRMRTQQMYGPCRVENVLYHVPKLIATLGMSQTPSITYSTGSLLVPFAFGSTGAVRTIRRKEVSGEALGALLLTFAVIGVVAAISS